MKKTLNLKPHILLIISILQPRRATPYNEEKLLITGTARTGGSMLARLFDGHPSVAAYPFEARFKAGHLLPVTPETGNLKATLKSNDRYALFQKVINGEKKAKGLQAKFDTQYFETFCDDCGNDNEPYDYIEKASEAFFRSCKNFSNDWNNISYIVWHASNATFGNILEALAADENLSVIFTIRHPFDVYASWQTYKQVSDNILNHMSHWCMAVTIAVSAKRLYPKQVKIMRYEDILNEPEAVMKDVAEWLHLPFHEIFLTPTNMGNKWSANSSYQTKEAGVILQYQPRFISHGNLSLWNDAEKFAGQFMSIAGYSAKEPYLLHPDWSAEKSIDALSRNIFTDYKSSLKPEGKIARAIRKFKSDNKKTLS